jgi:hypothetical protein
MIPDEPSFDRRRLFLTGTVFHDLAVLGAPGNSRICTSAHG